MSAHDVLARSRAKQGLPEALEDEATCERLAVLLRPDANDGADPNTDAAATRSTTTQPGQERKVRRA